MRCREARQGGGEASRWRASKARTEGNLLESGGARAGYPVVARIPRVGTTAVIGGREDGSGRRDRDRERERGREKEERKTRRDQASEREVEGERQKGRKRASKEKRREEKKGGGWEGREGHTRL